MRSYEINVANKRRCFLTASWSIAALSRSQTKVGTIRAGRGSLCLARGAVLAPHRADGSTSARRPSVPGVTELVRNAQFRG